MKVWDIICAVVLAIGGINWGLVGLFDYNLISTLFAEAPAISRVFYVLIGLSALYEIGDFAFGYNAMRERWCETPSTVRH